jgi:hypothetical protein
MANSPLDFPSTQTFRQRLIVKNLRPYQKSPNIPNPPYNFEIVLSNYAVVDSPDGLIDRPVFANRLYPLNQYGAQGGYIQTRDPNTLNNTHSNEGEYGYQDADILQEGYQEARKWKALNPYGDTNRVIDAAVDISSLNILQLNSGRGAIAQPYPTTFVPSFYSPLNILLSTNPAGSNGSLSQDSFLAKLGAKILKHDFEDRVAREVRRQTIGRANLLNANSGTDLLALVTGRVPILEPSFTITVPRNPITAAAQFALGLAGSQIPFSIIPGSYFDPTINPGYPTTSAQLQSAYNNPNPQTKVGQIISTLLGTGSKTGSQIFLDNTGQGQKSRLFSNLDYNRYKPSYDRSALQSIVNIVLNNNNNGEYYIGSPNSEPSRIFSPNNELPVNEFGQEIQTPVLGPQELAQLYEGPSQQLRLGANGPTYSDGGGIEGGFTWVSPKYKGNAGKNVGPGGDVMSANQDFKESDFLSTESTNYDFRTGSILDKTQRIINSQPQGGKRLQHVGNAIDQVSKVFHDGYKEMTKGSRVLSYIGDIGQEMGAEYCRVFTKDTPYLQYNDLQKTDGMTTEGRKFAYSVMDKTYNLNIAPNKMEGGQDSTNLIGGTGNNGYAKKYMFSIENLAWRTSNKPGFTYNDLPVCERGPNGGRVMWFPPYGLTFNENVGASWNTTEFLGRPEPVYTYKSTNRGGSLTWKIVVDHPSSLNVIVNKVLAKETNKAKIDSILESFFAGCRKYDLYELAKKYVTIGFNDLYQIQTELQAGETVTKDRIDYIKKEVSQPDNVVQDSTTDVNVDGTEFIQKYKTHALYFDNDYPKINNENYNIEFSRYTDSANITSYSKHSSNGETDTFFNNVVKEEYNYISTKMVPELKQILSDKSTTGNITIIINATASSPASIPYNKELSQRRIDSFITYLNSTDLKEFIGDKLLINKQVVVPEGEGGSSSPYSFNNGIDKAPSVMFTTPCTDNDGDNIVPSSNIYSQYAMACRRAYISDITFNLNRKETKKSTAAPKPIPTDATTTSKVVPYTVTGKPKEVTNTVQRDNISKKVLRQLLSECDYFEVVKEETPMVYDNLREKLKFFHPTFHSTTPEGLNSRLTFLQQCMRPGDTIPVVRTVDGVEQIKYDNNATNTSFGTPPVLVLRVGDFFHTKIIPESLALTYENLDINPEGIGLQPMIANVTLAFKFIGGQGLASAVDKLQNALSFNYYANTEMYDERSDVTDTSYKVLDKSFIDFFNATQSPPTINDAENANNNGQSNNSTIGSITSTVNSRSGSTGNINYLSIMDKLADETQNYFRTTFNKNKEVFKQYNNAVRQNWTLSRNYQKGKFLVLSDDVYLFGKPSKVEPTFNKVFKDFIDAIKSNDEGLISWISEPSKNFSSKVIRTLKENYKTYVGNKSTTMLSALFKIIQDYTIEEQNFVSTISRINTVTYIPIQPHELGTDGLQQKNGNIILYLISGTTEVDPSSTPVPANTSVELQNDAITVAKKLNEFNNVISSKMGTFNFDGRLIYDTNPPGKIFSPFTTKTEMIDDINLQRAYFILNDDIVNGTNYNKFKSALIGNILTNTALFGTGNMSLESEFDAYWNSVKPVFEDENALTDNFLNYIETNTLKDYLTTTPYVKGKKRNFGYTTTIDGGEESYNTQRNLLISSLGASSNKKTTLDTWNDEISNSVYVGKVKFN